MSRLVTVTVNNQLGKSDIVNEAFTLKLAQPPTVISSGKVLIAPQDIPNQTFPKSNNAGIYQSTTSTAVRGIAVYELPDKQNLLVIFFNQDTVLLSTTPVGTTSDVDTINNAEKNGTRGISGSYVVDGTVFKYNVCVGPSVCLRMKRWLIYIV